MEEQLCRTCGNESSGSTRNERSQREMIPAPPLQPASVVGVSGVLGPQLRVYALGELGAERLTELANEGDGERIS
jgi:hypothetical protein